MADFIIKNKWVLAGTVVLIAAVPSFFIFAKDAHRWTQCIGQLEKLHHEKKLQSASVREAVSPRAVNIPIFIYHSVIPHYPGETASQDAYDVTPELFESELRYLESHHYTAISLDDVADYFDMGKPLPQNPVILNFDDGWENQFIYAFPLLKKYHYEATFFIYTNVIDHSPFLSWKQIKEMVESGMAIGGHTKTHPLLTNIANADELRDEIVGGKKILEDHLRRSVTVFAYPYGDYNNAVASAVKEAGFRMARSTYRGVSHTPDDRYALKGILVSDSLEDFIRMLQAAEDDRRQ